MATEIYKDSERMISTEGDYLIINNPSKGILRKFEIGLTSHTSRQLPDGVQEALKKQGKDPMQWFTFYEYGKQASAVLPIAAEGVLDEAVRTVRIRLETERNDPSNIERRAIIGLYEKAYAISQSGREDNVEAPMRLRREADKRLEAWRLKYPDKARKEDADNLIARAEHEEKLASGALSYSADGWIDEAGRKQRHDEMMAKAQEYRKQAEQLMSQGGAFPPPSQVGNLSDSNRQLNPFQERVLQVISDNARSGKRIGAILSAFAQAVIDSPAPSQGGLMTLEPVSKAQIFESAVKRATTMTVEDVARLFDRRSPPKEQMGFDFEKSYIEPPPFPTATNCPPNCPIVPPRTPETKKYTPFKFQAEGIAWLKGRKFALLADDMGLGKAQPLDSHLLTSNGWQEMATIKLGDSVYGSDGILHEVLGVYPQGVKDVYKITFTDGSNAECTLDHLWTVNTAVRKYQGYSAKTFTLKQIIEKGLKYKNGNTKFFVPMVSTIKFPERDLPLHPYVIGVLIGDGYLAGGPIWISSGDSDVIAKVDSLLPNGMRLVYTAAYDYRIVTPGAGTSTTNYVKDVLKRLGLRGSRSSTKFIPDEYKYSAVHQRLSLLQGLMDTDGYVSKDGIIVQFSSVSERLCDDVQFIIESLGGKAVKSSKIPGYSYKGEHREGQRAYTLNISMVDMPFSLKRKAQLVKPRSKYLPFRGITKVEIIGQKPCQCIAIDSEDKLYVTDHCILTHNTNQAIFWASDNLPALVVVPAAVVWNWHREITTMWRVGDKAIVLDGKTEVPAKLPDWIILSYNALDRYLDDLKVAGFKSLIIDEAHYVKNQDTKRTKNIINLIEPDEYEKLRRAELQGDASEVATLQKRIPRLKPIEYRLAVTGTPVLNRPIELFAILRFLGVKKQSEYRDFLETFTEHKYVRGRLIFTGARNLAQLHREIQPFMLRRLKKDVLKDLPPKINTPMFVPISNAAEYREAESNFMNWLSETKGEAAAERAVDAEIIVKMNSLRQLAATGKVDPVSDWLKPCSETGSKVLVFCSFTEPLLELERRKRPLASLYTGSTSKEERQAIVDKFQHDPNLCYFLGTIGAAGVGITLTAANRVAFMDLPWTPGGKVQAEDRAHRIGQTKQVEIVNVLAKGTIDERMLELLQEKEFIIAQAVDGKTVDEAMTGSIAANLMRSFMQSPQLSDTIKQYVPDTADADIDEVQADILQGYLSDSIFSGWDMLKGKVDMCNLTGDEADRIMSWGPLRDFVMFGVGGAGRVKICHAGFIPGAYQVTIEDVKGKEKRELAVKIGNAIPRARRVYTQDDNLIYEVVVPEMRFVTELEWSKQEVAQGKGERGEQTSLLDPMVRSETVAGELSSVDIPVHACKTGGKPVDPVIRKAIIEAEDA